MALKTFDFESIHPPAHLPDKETVEHPGPYTVNERGNGHFYVIDGSGRLFLHVYCWNEADLEVFDQKINGISEGVVGELKAAFAQIDLMTDEKGRSAAVKFQYSRREYAFCGPYPVLNAAQARAIAALFEAHGRKDLSDIVRAIKRGQELLATGSEGIIELNELIHDGFFAAEEIGTTDEVLKKLLLEKYRTVAPRVIGFIRTGQGDPVLLYSLLKKYLAAGVTSQELALTPEEQAGVVAAVERSKA